MDQLATFVLPDGSEVRAKVIIDDASEPGGLRSWSGSYMLVDAIPTLELLPGVQVTLRLDDGREGQAIVERFTWHSSSIWPQGTFRGTGPAPS